MGSFLKPSSSTGYFSTSTGLSVTSGQSFPFIRNTWLPALGTKNMHWNWVWPWAGHSNHVGSNLGFDQNSGGGSLKLQHFSMPFCSGPSFPAAAAAAAARVVSSRSYLYYLHPPCPSFLTPQVQTHLDFLE